MPNNTDNIQLIDSHCHLDFSQFKDDRNVVLQNCAAKNIRQLLIPGVQANTWQALIELCESQNTQAHNKVKLHYALGLHPVFLEQHSSNDLIKLDHLVDQSNAVAIGEIGLDFFIPTLDKQKQVELFEAQLSIAAKHDLPVILHVRKAHDDVIKRLKTFNISGGIVHAFNGSIQQAHHYIELGFKLGFGGMLTYERSTKLRKLAKELPIESIVLETDSPDMTVMQHKGQRNSPEYLPYILASLNQLREESITTLADVTSTNFLNAMRL